MDKAPASGAGDSEFESRAGHFHFALSRVRSGVRAFVFAPNRMTATSKLSCLFFSDKAEEQDHPTTHSTRRRKQGGKCLPKEKVTRKVVSQFKWRPLCL